MRDRLAAFWPAVGLALGSWPACSGETLDTRAGDGGPGGAGDASADVLADGAPDVLPDALVAPPDCQAPPPNTGCDALSAPEVVAFIYCREPYPWAYSPPGVFPDRPAHGTWFGPCSNSAKETHERATLWAKSPLSPDGPFEILNDSSAKQYFESLIRFYGATATGEPQDFRYRNTSCGYFDGTTLGGAPFLSAPPLLELGGYLWYTKWGNVLGSHMVAGRTWETEVGFEASVCETRFSRGDWGLCDDISVVQTDYALDPATGEVGISSPKVVLQATGKCH